MSGSTAPRRVDSLDGIRTIAVLLVVAFHVGVPGLSGGYLGVDVFFVLSGFLITTLLIKELSRTGRIDLGRFWARRALRLMPAALLVILAVVLWALFVAEPYRRPGIGADALWSLLYVANWRFVSSSSYFADDGTDSPLLHVWSLAVEEQFYVAWPLLLTVVGVLVWRRATGAPSTDSAARIETDRRRRAVIATAVGAVALTLAVASAVWLWTLYDPSAPDRAYMGTDTKIFEPLIGALAAAIMTRRAVQRWVVAHHVALIAAGLAGIAVGVVTLGGPSPLYFAGGAVAFSICCAVLVAAATAGGNSELVARTLGLAPVAYLGRISYGIYLWHWPLAVWLLTDPSRFEPARAVAAVAFTIVLASLSYHLVEVPIRTGSLGRLEPARLLPAGAGVLAAAVAFSTLLGGTTVSRLNPWASSVAEAAEQNAVVVVGDSVMSRLVPSLAAEGTTRGMTVLSAARGGCPALTVPAVDAEGTLLAKGACTEAVRSVQDEAIAQADPGIVLWWSRYELADRRSDDGRILVAGTPEFWDAQRVSLRADVDRLTTHGARLVIVETDRPGAGLATRCTPESCHPFLHRLWYQDDLRRTWNDIVRETAEDDPRVRTIAIDDAICHDDAVPCDDRLPLPSSPGAGPSPAEAASTPGSSPGFARPDGSHFAPEVAPQIAKILLDRVTTATQSQTRTR